jgi:hypothetical protein
LRRRSHSLRPNGLQQLLQLRAAMHQVLLDIADHQLHFKIVLVLLRDLIQTREDGLEIGQVIHRFDLLIQLL